MFRFEHGEYLWALLLIPVMVGFFFFTWRFRKKAIQRFGNPNLVSQLMPKFSNTKYLLKLILLVLSFTFLVIAMANPQWGTKKEKVKRKNIDVFLALDVSYSMLAEDVAPSRLDRAKKFLEDLIFKLRGERLGFISFAGNAYLESPLMSDYEFITLKVRSVNPYQIPTQGTAISEAVDLAEQMFKKDNKSHKALIIITDGETHDDATLASVQAASKNGLIIFTIGVGTSSGSFIPVMVNNRSDFKRDQTGNPVRTMLDENVLQSIAKAADGAYFNLSAGSDQVLSALKNKIDQIQKQESEQRVFQEYDSYFQYFLAVGLFFLLLEVLISYRKTGLLEGKNLFGEA